ncbi:MAG TPA: threonine aldolase family protein [Acidisphaera sp.]|nr:threonine aldolase family protein [Acidisphaera sp.]
MFTPARPDPSLPPVRVNLYSDTQTRPSPAMKEAMMRAEVGDEQHGDDPTVWLLCDRMAALLGKEAAVFLPSGTMCNQVAILTHCRPGDEILAHQRAHIVTSEGGAAAALAGAFITGLSGACGMFTPDDVRAALRPRTRYAPSQALLAVEQTSNLGGGAVWPVERLDAVAKVAHEAGLATHMDGARLMNAVVASGRPAADHAANCDSVWLDFTKGLGAPLGAVLAGSRAFIGAAWRWKQRLGGSMRQGGICAAACLHALDHNIERLADDHLNAARFARGLAQIEGFTVEDVQTNLVFFDTSGTGRTAAQIEAAARRHGLMISSMGPYRGRACTHLDVDAAGIDTALSILREVVAKR